MRELDVLLQRWLDRHFDAATDAQKSAFQALLALPDPELAAYVLRDGLASQPDTAHVLQQIRAPFSA